MVSKLNLWPQTEDEWNAEVARRDGKQSWPFYSGIAPPGLAGILALLAWVCGRAEMVSHGEYCERLFMRSFIKDFEPCKCKVCQK